jgi:predicted MPP superfamily phosphohydrolase
MANAPFFLVSTLAVSTLWLVGLRVALAVLLAGVQLCLARAVFKMLRSGGLDEPLRKRLDVAARVMIAVMNVPLALFVLETLVAPRHLLLYSPPDRYQFFIRPVAYAFFIWSLGSLLFVLASPVAMALFASVQFFRRRRSESGDGVTIHVFDLTRRRFLQLALAAAAAVPFAASAYGAVAARFRKVVERVTILVKDLPQDLDGLTVVQLSDIHSGMFMPEQEMSEYARIAHELAPDIIALTGDFVATKSSQVKPFLSAMKGLKAKYGIFACLGNHDMFTASEEELDRGFERAGIELLRNEHRYLTIGGARLNVIGVDFIEPRRGSAGLARVLRDIPLDGTTLLLSHNPNTFPDAAKAGIDLTLSGHTHGGQIALNFGDLIIAPARLATMFLAGLFKIGESHLYVNRGLGTTGPPIRIGAPPEITHITLRRGA